MSVIPANSGVAPCAEGAEWPAGDVPVTYGGRCARSTKRPLGGARLVQPPPLPPRSAGTQATMRGKAWMILPLTFGT